MNLFMVYVGGYTASSNIELHDMRFVVGETIESCYPQLLKEWWGEKKMFHIDAWGAIKVIDGYEIEIKDSAAEHTEKLYFVNLGGYDINEFTELHKNILVVANDENEAKHKAKSQIQDWIQPHKDNLFEVEKVLEINLFGNKYIHLKKSTEPDCFEFKCEYKPVT